MQFKVKFFGTKEPRGQLVQVKRTVEATSKDMVLSALTREGFVKVNGLKITEVK